MISIDYRWKKENDRLHIVLCNGSKYYLPALAGDLPHGEDMTKAAQAYIADMTADGGHALAACHVSVWAEFSAALAIAAAKSNRL